MKVKLLKLYQSYNKVYAPGVYEIDQLPVFLRSNLNYVEPIKEVEKQDIPESEIDTVILPPKPRKLKLNKESDNES